LLRIAECNLYRPLWSQRITDEAVSALHRVHPEIRVPQFVSRFDQMTAAFEDVLVVGWERLEHDLVLPDPNDRHVLAAAIRGSAGIIVTNNTKDFPPGLSNSLMSK
jgi:predicted nucleic acid-binding protein